MIKRRWNKKGVDVIMSNIIFILLNLIFFAAMFYFVSRASSGDSFYEQRYAKKIALMIDEAKPNTHIELDISKLMEKADKNNYKDNIVTIENNKVIVRLRQGKGYNFIYFSDVKIDKLENRETKKLILDVNENV